MIIILYGGRIRKFRLLGLKFFFKNNLRFILVCGGMCDLIFYIFELYNIVILFLCEIIFKELIIKCRWSL